MALLKGIMGLLAATVTLKNCGKSTDQATLTGFGFSPVSPAPGDLTELWVAYDLKTPITNGTATYSATLNFIPFPATVDPLCTQTECPKEIGSYNETSQSNFPSGISGKLVSKIQWTDQEERPVWCLESTFQL